MFGSTDLHIRINFVDIVVFSTISDMMIDDIFCVGLFARPHVTLGAMFLSNFIGY